ncbi:zinc finger RNA-binding protein 2 isoform X2 [Paramormyrops kingsleyae]|uniref:zinc finger RNA-binding protein 2 isoform X2 n=1 Tax=Paramormyrops kingsleyae TaxID=1676925 RepID=UPI003B96DA84
MAASNYYGFAHGAGPQYSAQPPAAYSHPTTGSYAIQPGPSVAHAVTASYAPATVQTGRPIGSAAYPGYQIHPAPDYGYGARQPESASQPTTAPQTYQDSYSYGRAASAGAYESKQYYQASAGPAPVQRTAADTYYQTVAKSAYSQPAPQRQVTALKPVAPASSVAVSYGVYPASSSSICSYAPSSSYSSSAAPAYSAVSYSSYDPSCYAASPSYFQASQQPQPAQPPQPPPQPQLQPQPQQQQQPPAPKLLSGSSWSGAAGAMATAPASTSNATGGYKKPTFHQSKPARPKGPPKQPQLHYCEICKISCAGPQTYREHLEGQKHKKKESAQRGGQPSGGPRGVQTQLLCELCDISCTGADAYAAHIRGAKHQKVVKLYNKLGKPIPSTEPVLVNSAPTVTTTTSGKPTTPTVTPASSASPATTIAPPPKATSVNSNRTLPTARKPAAPKITFVSNEPAPAAPVAKGLETKTTVAPRPDPPSEDEEGDGAGPPGDVQPVGHDYVEEVRNEDGKVIRFHCKLCECSFNDPNAKDMHLKGRRHRLQYKKKVNPELPVDIKPSNRARKLLEGKLRKQKAALKRQHDEEQRWHMEMRRYEEDVYWRRMEEEQLYWEEQRRRMAPLPPLMGRPCMPVPPLLVFSNKPARRPDSPDDRHVMAKHSSIYPVEEELQAVQKIVSHSERALKLVSDLLMEAEPQLDGEKASEPPVRTLKGVMRVGTLAKGLLLRGDRDVELILLSAHKPTESLLNKIAQQLPKALKTFCEEVYEVRALPEEASVVVCSSKEPKMQATVSLTSPLMREELAPAPAPAPGADQQAQKGVTEPDPQDILDRRRCLEGLATLRHAKWFQARANGLQSCVIVIRVLQDLCRRVPTWGKMPSWALELLVEKAISSAPGPLSPGEALRRVLECMATGILLPDGPGLLDPCEKDQTDVLEGMTNQAREDITASAQHALRLLAFRQIHKVLGMECLPASKARPGGHTRKRRLDGGESGEGEGEGKKDKKEEEEDEEDEEEEDS